MPKSFRWLPPIGGFAAVGVDAGSGLYGFSGHELRPPPLWYGLGLSFFGPIWLVVTIAISMAPAAVVWATGSFQGPWGVGAAVWLVVSYKVVSGAGNLLMLKFQLDHVTPRFTTTMLRPFGNKDASILFQGLVAPPVAAYGFLYVIADATLGGSGPDEPTAPVNTRILWRPESADTFPDDEWRARIYSMIAVSDLAVIDLTLPSPNILWEMVRCFELLPPHRVLFVKVKGRPWAETMNLVREYLAETLPTESTVGAHELTEPISYGGFLAGGWRFRIRLFLALRRIAKRDLQAAGRWRPSILPEVQAELDRTEPDDAD